MKVVLPLLVSAALLPQAVANASPFAGAQRSRPLHTFVQTHRIDAMAPSPTTATPSLQDSIRLAAKHLNDGRYGDAADEAEAAVEAAPDCPASHVVRGAVALWIGVPHYAAEDFRTALRLDPADPAAELGAAESRMMIGGDTGDALKRLRSQAALSSDQQKDADTAIAYLAFVYGDMPACREIVANTVPGDEARAEIEAMVTAHSDRHTGIASLTRFLNTESGVPHVVEDPGLRQRFETSPGLIEPSVLEPVLQRLYRARLEQNLRHGKEQASQGDVLTDTVTVSIARQEPLPEPVSLTVDDDVVATTDRLPYSFTLDTHKYSNGHHTVRIAARLNEGGTLDLLDRPVRFANRDSTVAVTANTAGLDPTAYAAVQSTAWNLLRLRPSRRVAETVLARLESEDGDSSDAAAHDLVAIALDPVGQIGHSVGKMILQASRAETAGAVMRSAIHEGSPNRRWVALTFDDGPNPTKTPALLDALASVHASATFFVVGTRAEAAPDLVRRMSQEGHDVENHSYTHPNIAQCIPSTVESEILRTSIIVHSLTGSYPVYFRPPGGDASGLLTKLASDYGETLAFWSIDAISAEYAGSPQGLVQFVMRRVNPGSVVLMHNGLDTTTAAVPLLVSTLRAHGYTVVTLRRLMAGS